MTGEQFSDQVTFEANLKPGDRVRVCWTNGGSYYHCSAVIVRVNAKSVRAAIEHDITDGRSGSLPTYSKGREIIVPRLTITTIDRWSYNNGVFPLPE